MNKNLFIYWNNGFENSPLIVKKCLQSWKNKNFKWNIHILSDNNLTKYINIKNYIDISNKNISKAHFADIIRVLLLEKYGGCWCDATTYCNIGLDDWLFKYIKSGFFAFCNPGPDRMLSNWFLYSEKNNYIITEWRKYIINYWKQHSKIEHYFMHHYLFAKIYNNDIKFKNIWNNTIKYDAKFPHTLLNYGLNKKINENIKSIINNNKSQIPLFKLTYKYDKSKVTNDSVISYILNL